MQTVLALISLQDSAAVPKMPTKGVSFLAAYDEGGLAAFSERGQQAGNYDFLEG